MVSLLDRMAQRAAEACDVREFYVLRIRGWFGARWFRFSGKAFGAFGVWKRPQTLPPFVPARVLRQDCFTRDQDEQWQITERRPIHRKQSGSSNLAQSLDKQLSLPTGILWFGLDDHDPQRLSVMCYLWTPEEICDWYVSLVQKDGAWIDEKCVGINRSQYESLHRAG